MRRILRRDRDPEPPAGEDAFSRTVSAEDRAIVERVSPFTMTSPQRVQAVIDSVRYCEVRGLDGAFAECGVWLGGSVLAMVLTLQELGAERDIWLYDTFEGMTAPTEHDTTPFGESAVETWQETVEGERAWGHFFDPQTFGEETVRRTLLATGYPEERLHFVRGPVEQTLLEHRPESLALLRLDTDWYESTRAELEHLYPLLASGGVLIVDDYGHWRGSAKAVDEYFAARTKVLLARIDYTGRIAVKP